MTQDVPTDQVSAALDGRELVVVSNRQPYSHNYCDGEVTVDRPAGGLTATLDPLLESLEGTWVAWGDGDADREVADDDGCVRLPPESESYELRRVWLADDEVEDYYYGYSNQVLWPLCHLDTAKISVEPGQWETYREVNDTFADAVVDRADDDAVVWFQDYHFGLAPRRVREALPGTFLAHFWHIPWPAWDCFRACPHYEQLLDGLLANDLIGFHTRSYCRNFLECVEAATDATVDRESGSVVYGGDSTLVRAFPIGIDADHWSELARSPETDERWRSFRETYGLDGVDLAVGVERLDYTKGIERRLDALEHLFETHPERRGELTYVQKGIESRSRIPAYERLQERIEARVAELNDRFGTDDWRPVVYVQEHLPKAALAALYREADVGLVTPVRDGMNLVAKEFVAAQTADAGVLVLSELTGANDQLGGRAVDVHPYDPESVADGVLEALTMPVSERERRMADLREEVYAHDVYDWVERQFGTIRTVEHGRELASELTTP